LSETATTAAPEQIVADIEARAARHETPCGDGVMVWRAWGRGPPLVMLHGGGGSWAHWIRNIDHLAAVRTIWAPDLPGFGDSASPPRTDDNDVFAEILAAGLRQVVGEHLPVDVVGFSFGGVTGAYLAAFAPELVRRLVLVDTGGLDTPMGEIIMQRVRGLEGEARRAALRANLLGLMIHDPRAVDDLAIFIQGRDPPRGRVNPGPLVLPHRLKEVLPRVRAQVDAIWGEYDLPHPDPAVQAAALRAAHPDLEMRVVPAAGHWAMYEGATAFNAALQSLLDQPLRAPYA
jgi:pimeloyl-ACP methyl ester carboxylesterase